MNYKYIITFAEKYKTNVAKVLPMRWLRRIKRYMLYKQSMATDYNFEAYNPSNYERGVNLYGDMHGISGLAESARILEHVIAAAHIPYVVRNFHVDGVGESSLENVVKEARASHVDVSSRQEAHSGGAGIEDSCRLQYGVNIFDISPSEMPLLYIKYGKEVFDRHYNIGYWVWETKTLPRLWIRSIDMVDEIWTPSEYASEIFRQYTDKPVKTVPHAISMQPDETSDRAYFEFPEDEFLILVLLDDTNPYGRKNPQAALQAYASIVDKCSAHLVIKWISHESIEGLPKEYRRYLIDVPSDRVHIVGQQLSHTEMNSLLACCDCFISLHRAEGFGLVMAEAMYLGKPVVATRYSANVEYMNDDNSCLVDYRLVDIAPGNEPFLTCDTWAEPDVTQAADYILKLATDSDYYKRISSEALSTISERLSARKIADMVEGYLR